jgi:hypothetical protein
MAFKSIFDTPILRTPAEAATSVSCTTIIIPAAQDFFTAYFPGASLLHRSVLFVEGY